MKTTLLSIYVAYRDRRKQQSMLCSAVASWACTLLIFSQSAHFKQAAAAEKFEATYTHQRLRPMFARCFGFSLFSASVLSTGQATIQVAVFAQDVRRSSPRLRTQTYTLCSHTHTFTQRVTPRNQLYNHWACVSYTKIYPEKHTFRQNTVISSRCIDSIHVLPDPRQSGQTLKEKYIHKSKVLCDGSDCLVCHKFSPNQSIHVLLQHREVCNIYIVFINIYVYILASSCSCQWFFLVWFCNPQTSPIINPNSAHCRRL